MKLAYEGFNRQGSSVADVIDARDIDEATEQLRRQGIYTTKVRSADSLTVKTNTGKGSAFGKGRRLKLVAIFLRQLHVLLVTGTPLAEALAALERQSSDVVWRGVVADVRGKVEQGIALSIAMADHPKYFNTICRGLVGAGEAGGNLDSMLERLAILARKQVHTRSSIIGAMIYPALLTVVAVGVLATLMLFVLPRFNGLFASLDTPLSPTTKLLMMISDAVRAYWWTSPFLLGGAVFGIWTILKTPAGRRGLDRAFIAVPQFGPDRPKFRNRPDGPGCSAFCCKVACRCSRR